MDHITFEEKKPVIISDLDGTLVPYKDFDISIVRNGLFKNNPIIRFVDNAAWKVNGMDILNNSISMLKLRFFLYCLISFKNYKKVFETYEKAYLEYVELSLNSFFQNKETALYNWIILTNNPIALNVKTFENVRVEYTPNSKKVFLKRFLETNQKPICFFGNSLLGDIIPAIKSGINPIYIGDKLRVTSNMFGFKQKYCILEYLKNEDRV